MYILIGVIWVSFFAILGMVVHKAPRWDDAVLVLIMSTIPMLVVGALTAGLVSSFK